MEALPEILADHTDRPDHATLSRVLLIEAPDIGHEERKIDRILHDDFLAHLPTIDDEELAEIDADLRAAELDISANRAAVHSAMAEVLHELTRRYRDGQASVDELLQPG